MYLGGSLRGEVGEAIGLHHISHTETGGAERSLERLGRVGVLDLGSANSRVDEWKNSAEFSSCRQSSVTTDRGDGLGARVEVLLGSDQSGGAGDDRCVVSKRLYDLIGKRQLRIPVSPAPRPSLHH